jgi:hypothetical protein
MALLWLEGFEGFGTSINNRPQPIDIMATKYPVINREFADLELRTGRLSGYAVACEGSGFFQSPSLTTDDTVVLGFAFRNPFSNDYTAISLYSRAQRGMRVFVDGPAGELRVYRDSTLLGTTSGLGMVVGDWYYIEFKVTTHDSTGSFELHVDEVNVLSASGIDTQAGADAYHDRFRCAGNGGDNPEWDDIYFLDSTGSSNNDFLGNVRVVAISPDGDDTANWTTSTPSANHYENVDENPCDEDTSYVEESTANLTDLYDYEAPISLGDIHGIQINTVCRETDATNFSLITPIESNGTQYDDSPQIVGTPDWLTVVRLEEEDPDTNVAWTEPGLNAAKFGVKIG